MSQSVLIKNAKIVNEGRIFEGDLRVEGQKFTCIEKIFHLTNKIR